jgi:hypothetical protein
MSTNWKVHRGHLSVAISNTCRHTVKMLIAKSLDWVAQELEIQGEFYFKNS